MYKYINLDYSGNIKSIGKKINYIFKHLDCGESTLSIKDEVKNDNVFIYQSFNPGSFDNDLMKLSLCCDILQRNNVKSIMYIAPFLPYTRQDKVDNTKLSLGCKILADILNKYNIKTIATYDLHSDCFITKLFDSDMKNIDSIKNEQFTVFSKNQKALIVFSAIPLFLKHIKKKYNLNKTTIVLPDAGAKKRFEHFFKNKNINIVFFKKTHLNNGKIKMSLVGEIKNKNIAIIDDIIDTGKTIIYAVEKIFKPGRKIIICATHGIFSSNSIKKIDDLPIEEIITTDSIKNINLTKKFKIIKLPVDI